MSGLARRPLLLALAALGLGAVAYELWPNDERRITALLNGLCSKLNETRDAASLTDLQAALRAASLPNASLRITELSLDAQGVDDITERARELLSSGVPLSFALNGFELHVSGHLARVDLDLILTTRGSGEQSRDLRHTHVRLAKAVTGWQVEAIEVDPVAPSEPEARP